MAAVNIRHHLNPLPLLPNTPDLVIIFHVRIIHAWLQASAESTDKHKKAYTPSYPKVYLNSVLLIWCKRVIRPQAGHYNITHYCVLGYGLPHGLELAKLFLAMRSALVAVRLHVFQPVLEGLGYSRYIRCEGVHVCLEQGAYVLALVYFEEEVLDIGCSLDLLESHEQLSSSQLAVRVVKFVALVCNLS